MRRSFTVRRTVISTLKEIFTKSAEAKPTSRSMRWSFLPMTGSTRCPTWRARPTAGPGMPTVRKRSLPPSKAGNRFFPDGSRPVEEVDRLSVGEHGTGNLMSAYAEFDFIRVLPPSGYKKGLPAHLRTDIGDGDIAPESMGRDFFPYRPPHLGQHPPRLGLARIVNAVQATLSSGKYAGAIWTQGSPRIEETLYWLHLLLDTTLPLCGNSAQRAHGMISNDGPKNLVDSVEFITSRVWADEAGHNRTGLVLIQEQQIFAARDVQKGDARPGGYVATGGHGGILGGIGFGGKPVQLSAGDAPHLSLRREYLAAIRGGHGRAARGRRAAGASQSRDQRSRRRLAGFGNTKSLHHQRRQLHRRRF
jgi:L-asparaginase